MKKNLVILGEESRYWLGLMEYMNEKGALQAFLCTDKDAVEKVVLKRKAEFLLMDEEAMDEEWKDIDQYSVPVILFTASRCGDGIYRYQPADCLYEELCRTVFHGEDRRNGRADYGKVCAVYSPLGRCGKTAFACAYARQHSFFYLGMEEYGTIGNNRVMMDEVLYHIKTRNPGVTQFLRLGAEDWEGIRVFASPQFFQDLRVMTGEDFIWFLEQIREEESFPPVIADLGTGCLIDLEILDAFDRVYIPVLPGETEMKKLERFREALYEVNGSMKEKLITIVVPNESWKEGGFLERVQYKKGLLF